MSEAPALFQLDDFEYFVNGRPIPKHADPLGERKAIDQAFVKLTVSNDPGTLITHYVWEQRSILFHTNNREQVLDIQMNSVQSWMGRPRFHLHRVDHNENYIRAIHYADEDAGGHMVALPSIHHALPPHTRRISIRLSLASSGPRTSFKLFVYAKDRELGRRINCDPIVGNDPPAHG